MSLPGPKNIIIVSMIAVAAIVGIVGFIGWLSLKPHRVSFGRLPPITRAFVLDRVARVERRLDDREVATLRSMLDADRTANWRFQVTSGAVMDVDWSIGYEDAKDFHGQIVFGHDGRDVVMERIEPPYAVASMTTRQLGMREQWCASFGVDPCVTFAVRRAHAP